MTASKVIAVFCGCLFALGSKTLLASPALHRDMPCHLAAEVKTFKVTLSKSDTAKNRTVYIQAKDSYEARDIAKEQNPGWQVEQVSEVK